MNFSSSMFRRVTRPKLPPVYHCHRCKSELPCDTRKDVDQVTAHRLSHHAMDMRPSSPANPWFMDGERRDVRVVQ